ncbi:ATP-binding protein [Streptomyces cyanogenus]|uniref:ATP-binding protein n=1 Tax=Streptomyces cyanogenus TaxID=80860 RepID=UPI003C7976FE
MVVADKGPGRSPRKCVQVRQGDADEEQGRGLFLVECLATRYEVQPTEDGTTVRP